MCEKKGGMVIRVLWFDAQIYGMQLRRDVAELAALSILESRKKHVTTRACCYVLETEKMRFALKKHW